MPQLDALNHKGTPPPIYIDGRNPLFLDRWRWFGDNLSDKYIGFLQPVEKGNR